MQANTRSSVDAEYRGLANAIAELQWVQSLRHELNIKIHTPTLFCDNQSAVLIAHNPNFHSRTKHLELDIHFVRKRVLAEVLNISHVLALVRELMHRPSEYLQLSLMIL